MKASSWVGKQEKINQNDSYRKRKTKKMTFMKRDMMDAVPWYV